MAKTLLLSVALLSKEAFSFTPRVSHGRLGRSLQRDSAHQTAPQSPVAFTASVASADDVATYQTAKELAIMYSEYSDLCRAAAMEGNNDAFATFKRQPCYMQILEHLTEEQGRMFVHTLQMDHPELLQNAALGEALRRNNYLGDPPVLARYDALAGTPLGDGISPTQLRYLKTVGDLQDLLSTRENAACTKGGSHPFSGCRIAEVGVGYGGLAQAVIETAAAAAATAATKGGERTGRGVASYELYDLPEVEALADKYLKATGAPHVWLTREQNVLQEAASSAPSTEGPLQIDLFGSNYALSELPRSIQDEYIENLAHRSGYGYVTWNTGVHALSMASDEFVRGLRERGFSDVTIVPESPPTAPDNVIITWGPPVLSSPPPSASSELLAQAPPTPFQEAKAEAKRSVTFLHRKFSSAMRQAQYLYLYSCFHAPKVCRVLLAAAAKPALALLQRMPKTAVTLPGTPREGHGGTGSGGKDNLLVAALCCVVATRLDALLPCPSRAAELWVGCSGGGARVDARSSFYLRTSPLKQVCQYAELCFAHANKKQREPLAIGSDKDPGAQKLSPVPDAPITKAALMAEAKPAVLGGGSAGEKARTQVPPPSFATFLLSCVAATRLPSSNAAQSTTFSHLVKEVPDPAAVKEAFATASPLMVSALQDMPGGMAGEGKLLNIFHLLRHALVAQVPGGVVELGCHKGLTACMMQALLVKDAARESSGAGGEEGGGTEKRKELHLFDSFEGLPVGDKDHDPLCYSYGGGAMRASPRDVASNFESCGLPQPRVHVGWFSDSCPGNLPETIAFAHLDGDLYASIKDSLELVYDRLAKGAIVVVDDYCDPFRLPRNDLFPGAYDACSEFLADKPEAIQVLPAPHPGYMDRNGFSFPAQYETHAYFEKL